MERSEGVKTKATKGKKGREGTKREGRGESHNGKRRTKAGKLSSSSRICGGGGGFTRLRTEKLVRKVRNEGRI